ncbi:MAG: hypothetical protein ACYC23_20900 [Limisphaerales bacterium]
MRILSIICVCFASLAAVIGAGCASRANRDRPEVGLQLQKSVVLSASRYTAIQRALDAGDLDEIQKDLDWWIDQAILELVLLEDRYPRGDWEAVQLQDSPLEMRSYYRRLAQFRRNHLRRHSVPLESERLNQIELFTQKYQ